MFWRAQELLDLVERLPGHHKAVFDRQMVSALYYSDLSIARHVYHSDLSIASNINVVL